MQEEAGAAAFERKWKRVCDKYVEHFRAIKPSLSPRARKLPKTTLHDGVVTAVDRPEPSVLVLDIDAWNNPWGARGLFRVKFTDVRRVKGIDGLVGDVWLYEEMHLHPDGIDFRVLFWRSDFRVVAGDAEMKLLGPATNAGKGKRGGTRV